MRRLVILSLGLVLLVCPGRLLGANSVVVESKDVPADATGIEVGIYIENDDSLAAVVIPLQFRQVTTGSFIADTLAIIPQNRLESYLIGSVVTDYFPGPDSSLWWQCNGEGFATRGSPDFVSPDAVFYGAIATSDSCLPIGDDGSPPGGSPSLLLTFNVTDVQGTFEIDTACVTPNNHLRFASCTDFDGITPSFTKGVIEIGCECDCHADPVCDSVHNVLDLVAIVGVAFQGADPIPDPNGFCPYETTDVNCDDVTDVLDVGLMNLVVNYGANPDSTFCDPCAP